MLKTFPPLSVLKVYLEILEIDPCARVEFTKRLQRFFFYIDDIVVLSVVFLFFVLFLLYTHFSSHVKHLEGRCKISGAHAGANAPLSPVFFSPFSSRRVYITRFPLSFRRIRFAEQEGRSGVQMHKGRREGRGRERKGKENRNDHDEITGGKGEGRKGSMYIYR